MGWNVFGLVCGVLAIGFFAATHRLAVGRTREWRWRLVAIAAAFALPALWQAAYYLRVTPGMTWLYEARSWRGSEAMVLPLGALGGGVAALLPRRWLVLPLLATTGAALGPFLKPVLAPLPEREFREVWTKNVCIQSTLSTCGPASVATVLRALGRAATEREIARAAHSYRGGTEAWYLMRWLRASGFVATPRFGKGFPADACWPAVVGVKVEEGRGHFIAILGRDQGRYLVGDPMVGPERRSREDLERRYGFTGFALEVSALNSRRVHENAGQ